MPHEKLRMEAMLFDHGTTYRTAFRGGPIPVPVATLYREWPARAERPPAIIRDIHTLTPWKNKIPFYLLHKPKDIVRTNPYKDLLSDSKNMPVIVDDERVDVQRRRPRLVMTPAVSMDDIEDGRARGVLCRDMYTSATSKALRDAAAPPRNVRARFPNHPARSNPIVLPKLQPPRVSPEWRMETVEWDGKQLRSFCDPTRDFWLNHELPKCKACMETDVMRSHRKMSQRKV